MPFEERSLPRTTVMASTGFQNGALASTVTSRMNDTDADAFDGVPGAYCREVALGSNAMTKLEKLESYLILKGNGQITHLHTQLNSRGSEQMGRTQNNGSRNIGFVFSDCDLLGEHPDALVQGVEDIQAKCGFP